MSSAEYKIVSTDPDEIISWLTLKWEEVTGSTLQKSSPEYLFIRWEAAALVYYLTRLNYAANQNIPSRATGENLDALSELTALGERPEATAASTVVRFTISAAQEFAVLIPSGTRVTDASSVLVWETLSDAYVAAGELTADVEVQCQTAGTTGNGYVAGQINTIVDVFPYFASCENITVSDGGSDAATDAEFYELMRLSMDGFSTAGARGGYVYHAKAVSTEIVDVAAVSPTPGVVKVYALTDGGELASETLKEKILEALSADDIRPLTDQVFVEDADVVEYDIDLTYYTDSYGGAAVQAAVNEAVEGYISWQCAKIGRNINPSELISHIMGAGVRRVDVRSPVFTRLEAGDDETVPQVARLRSLTVLNGGAEDE